jgi:hypothetical protein
MSVDTRAFTEALRFKHFTELWQPFEMLPKHFRLYFHICGTVFIKTNVATRERKTPSPENKTECNKLEKIITYALFQYLPLYKTKKETVYTSHIPSEQL